MSLLPANATPFQRALEDPLDMLIDIPVPLRELWNPATIPLELLPWLAWALSVDRWDANWSEAVKRDAVAQAIPRQRRKGTVTSVKEVLASFDELLELVEWWEQTPRTRPGTFEVRLPMDGAGGTRSTAAFAEAIIRDVIRVKPVRAHFEMLQTAAFAGQIGLIGTARGTLAVRFDGTATADTSQPWDKFLQAETGEPFEAGNGEFLQERT